MIDTWLWSHRFFKRYKILHPKICDVWFCFVLILRCFICKPPLEMSFSYNLKRVWKVEITKCELILYVSKDYLKTYKFIWISLHLLVLLLSDLTMCAYHAVTVHTVWRSCQKTYLQIRSWPTFLSRTYWELSKHTKWVFYTRNIVCLKHISDKTSTKKNKIKNDLFNCLH